MCCTPLQAVAYYDRNILDCGKPVRKHNFHQVNNSSQFMVHFITFFLFKIHGKWFLINFKVVYHTIFESVLAKESYSINPRRDLMVCWQKHLSITRPKDPDNKSKGFRSTKRVTGPHIRSVNESRKLSKDTYQFSGT